MTQEELNEIFRTTQGLFNKDSKQYQAQVAVNKSLEIDNTPDPLTDALSEASHLDGATKSKYIHLAGMYLSDMQKNILKDQFELSKDYPEVTPDEWNDFLSDRIVSTYITKHKRTLLKAAAEFNLALPGAKNKRDSLQLIRDIESKEQGEQNRNVVIMRIPDIYDEE